ncbi:MAG: bifunctional phosphoglucose/phosphomannose isomerase [Saprospiraceae bacterium]|nr:bifunctional phosphoglucose/phosphomannose isomerase [Saprospiraceae bacterium]
MMDELISKFPAQLTEALEIGQRAQLNHHTNSINKVFVAGMGGSGIGADFVASFVRDECKVPYLVGKSYDIPSYVDENTLAIASSYSGNTEETLVAFEQMLKSGAKVVVISGGGQLIEKAKSLGLDFIQVPGDWPSPRACLGYSLVQQLYVLYHLDLISNKAIKSVENSVRLLENASDDIKSSAEKAAQTLYHKMPIIYTTDRMEPVAIRFRQQVNENSKMLCWHHVIPEMNHNELVGWRDVDEKLAVIYFRSEDDYYRNKVRIEINKEIIDNYTHTIIEFFAQGSDLVEQSLYLVHLGDWISFYLAELRGMDAVEVKVIDHLKSELKKH